MGGFGFTVMVNYRLQRIKRSLKNDFPISLRNFTFKTIRPTKRKSLVERRFLEFIHHC